MELDINRIKELLPHRFPFLLVDRIISYEPRVSIIGMKNVTANEDFFEGHFPQQPVMPGVLIIECLAQTAAVLLLSEEENRGKIPFFTGIDNARFRRQVVPGDQLRLEVEVLKVKGHAGKAKGRAMVEGELVAEAELLFFLGPGRSQPADNN